jgi:hypothetical protein
MLENDWARLGQPSGMRRWRVIDTYEHIVLSESCRRHSFSAFATCSEIGLRSSVGTADQRWAAKAAHLNSVSNKDRLQPLPEEERGRQGRGLQQEALQAYPRRLLAMDLSWADGNDWTSDDGRSIFSQGQRIMSCQRPQQKRADAQSESCGPPRGLDDAHREKKPNKPLQQQAPCTHWRPQTARGCSLNTSGNHASST